MIPRGVQTHHLARLGSPPCSSRGTMMDAVLRAVPLEGPLALAGLAVLPGERAEVASQSVPGWMCPHACLLRQIVVQWWSGLPCTPS